MAKTGEGKMKSKNHDLLSSSPVEKFMLCNTGLFILEGYGDNRDLHRVDRRQRQMCIRDRLWAHALLHEPDERSPAGGCGPGTRHCLSLYTHLRAHETRHDLVCRLLLEK